MEQQDLEVTQGSTFEWLMLINDINGSPLDMNSYTGGTAGARGKIRKKYTDLAATASFTCSILNNTGVSAALTSGTLHLTTAEIAALKADTYGKCYVLATLPATTTAGIAKGTYVYDIEIEDGTGFVFKPYAGTVIVSPEATK